MRHLSRLLAVIAVLVLATALAGCSSEDDEPGPTTVEVTFSGDSVTPLGERITVSKGEPVTFHITAEEPGELHIHSEPEQEIAYDAGTSDHEITLDQTGIIAVESHQLEVTIVQLEVR